MDGFCVVNSENVYFCCQVNNLVQKSRYSGGCIALNLHACQNAHVEELSVYGRGPTVPRSSQPPLAGVPDFLKDAPLLGQAVPAGRARGTAGPLVGVAVHVAVVDVVVGLPVVGVEQVPARAPVVAHHLPVAAFGEVLLVALLELEIAVVADVDLVVEDVEYPQPPAILSRRGGRRNTVEGRG